jgi:hypothetical protein
MGILLAVIMVLGLLVQVKGSVVLDFAHSDIRLYRTFMILTELESHYGGIRKHLLRVHLNLSR